MSSKRNDNHNSSLDTNNRLSDSNYSSHDDNDSSLKTIVIHLIVIPVHLLTMTVHSMITIVHLIIIAVHKVTIPVHLMEFTLEIVSVISHLSLKRKPRTLPFSVLTLDTAKPSLLIGMLKEEAEMRYYSISRIESKHLTNARMSQ